MKKKAIQWMIIIAAGLMVATGAHGAVVDHSLYAELLNRHVSNGLVNYEGMQKEEALLDRYLDTLAGVDPAALSADEQFAFYANAYNAWTIKFILSKYPDIDSIKDLGSLFSSPWKKKIARIDGQTMTLDQIEHDILRKTFRDPRVHFAVNCASMGCPPLYAEPFVGERLDMQLNHATRSFINDSSFNRLEGNTLWVSKIFDWFAEDFDHDVVTFFIRFADDPLKKQLVDKKEAIRVKYLKYDWSLNKS